MVRRQIDVVVADVGCGGSCGADEDEYSTQQENSSSDVKPLIVEQASGRRDDDASTTTGDDDNFSEVLEEHRAKIPTERDDDAVYLLGGIRGGGGGGCSISTFGVEQQTRRQHHHHQQQRSAGGRRRSRRRRMRYYAAMISLVALAAFAAAREMKRIFSFWSSSSMSWSQPTSQSSMNPNRTSPSGTADGPPPPSEFDEQQRNPYNPVEENIGKGNVSNSSWHFSASSVPGNDESLFQPKVTIADKVPSHSFAIIAMPDGAPWCPKGQPSVWFTGHQPGNVGTPYYARFLSHFWCAHSRGMVCRRTYLPPKLCMC